MLRRGPRVWLNVTHLRTAGSGAEAWDVEAWDVEAWDVEAWDVER